MYFFHTFCNPVGSCRNLRTYTTYSNYSSLFFLIIAFSTFYLIFVGKPQILYHNKSRLKQKRIPRRVFGYRLATKADDWHTTRLYLNKYRVVLMFTTRLTVSIKAHTTRSTLMYIYVSVLYAYV